VPAAPMPLTKHLAPPSIHFDNETGLVVAFNEA
jgi:hypothetical protein